MCGFVGYLGVNANSLDLTPAAQKILHRGPDMQGVQNHADWAVAFNRLSILDISEEGMQPFSWEGVTVYANGEIYNYQELKEEHQAEYQCRSGSDVEILPFLYRKYGIEFLQKLNGMFAMILIDEKLGIRYLIRDRYGKKPLFYTATSQGLFFASELKALEILTPLTPDPINIASNLFCWFLVQPLTLYKKTYNINPGSYLKYTKDGSFQEIRWYHPRIQVKSQSFEEIQENFLKLYRESVKLRLRSDVPIGIFLSGGLDSTSQAYFANELSNNPVTAFTGDIRDKILFEDNNTDIEIPQKLCQEFGWNMVQSRLDFDFFNQNIVRFIEHYEEIFVNSGVLIFYALAQAAQQHGVKVIFTGVGGDELFGGYPWQARIRFFPKWLMTQTLQQPLSEFSHILRKTLSSFSEYRLGHRVAAIQRLLSQTRLWHAQSLSGMFQPWMTEIDREVSCRIDPYSRAFFQEASDCVDGDLYNQWHFANIWTVIASQNYMSDMGCMFSSVENRSPLLDVNVFEYMMSIPDHIKVQDGQKSLFRKILKSVMPDYVTQAKKSGPTMPLHIWFEHPALRVHVNAFLQRNIALIAEYISPQLAHAIQKNEDLLYQHRSLPLFAILSFLIWAKQRIEKSIPDSTISFMELIRA